LAELAAQIEDRFSGISDILDGSPVYGWLAAALESTVQFGQVFETDVVERGLAELGFEADTVNIFTQSFANINRVTLF
jgi:hypothetical protein